MPLEPEPKLEPLPGLWAQYDLSTETWEHGAALFDFIDRSQEWVKRRIEQIRFDDDQTLQRVTVLDVDLSAPDLAALPLFRGRRLLPVKLLNRNSEVDATVTDAMGVPLPQLTRRHERALVAAGLVATYEGKLVDPSVIFRRILANIETSLFSDNKELDSNDGVFLDTIEQFRQQRVLIAAVTEPDGHASVEVGQGLLARLLVTHSENLRDGADGPKTVSPVRRTRQRLDDEAICFTVNQADMCESFHFQLDAPSGILIRETRLLVRAVVGDHVKQADILHRAQGAATPQEQLAVLAELTVETEAADDDPHVSRAHLYYCRPDDDRVFESGSVTAVFRPMTSGAMRPGLFASILCTIVLVATWCTLGWSGAPAWAPRPLNVSYTPVIEAVVAGILLGPTLVAGVVVGSDEHLLAKRFIFRHRVRLALQGSATFGVSALYAAGVPEGARWWLVGIAALASLASTIRTVWSYGASRRAIKGEPAATEIGA